ncbi:hydroxyisourate hydrolase [Chromatiales bacterium (ex Bugula neritina AB1)]|nr:hydroxyisourate hydrolase [Chromatiales bacterium (ex Bugula neritina AB1)]
MTKLTTHVLDTANGVPAEDMTVRLSRITGDNRQLLLETRTNSDGRCDAPLLSGEEMQAGRYELEFEAGTYFGSSGGDDSIAFLDCVVLRFGISDPQSHYHVPLLVSPYSYSTYRGS